MTIPCGLFVGSCDLIGLFLFFHFLPMQDVSPSGVLFVTSLLVGSVPFEFLPELADGTGRPAVIIDPSFESIVDGIISRIDGLEVDPFNDYLRVVLYEFNSKAHDAGFVDGVNHSAHMNGAD